MLPVLYLATVALAVAMATIALHRESRFPRTLLVASIGTVLGAVGGAVLGAMAEAVSAGGGAVTAVGAGVAPLGAILAVVVSSIASPEAGPLDPGTGQTRQRGR